MYVSVFCDQHLVSAEWPQHKNRDGRLRKMSFVISRQHDTVMSDFIQKFRKQEEENDLYAN